MPKLVKLVLIGSDLGHKINSSECKVYCATCIRVSIRISVFWVFFMVHTLMNVFGCCVVMFGYRI